MQAFVADPSPGADGSLHRWDGPVPTAWPILRQDDGGPAVKHLSLLPLGNRPERLQCLELSLGESFALP